MTATKTSSDSDNSTLTELLGSPGVRAITLWAKANPKQAMTYSAMSGFALGLVGLSGTLALLQALRTLPQISEGLLRMGSTNDVS